MIWPDWKIKQFAANGGVSNFDEKCANPASLDLRWSGRASVAKYQKWVLGDSGWHGLGELDDITIAPKDLVLLDTMEYVSMPDDVSGLLMLKSSIGRMGLQQLHTGLFDPGFHGTATVALKNVSPWPVTLTKGQRFVQLQFFKLCGHPDRSYQQTGRYNGQSVPQEAK